MSELRSGIHDDRHGYLNYFYSFIYLFIHSFVRSFVRSFVCFFVCLYTYIHIYIYIYVYLFIYFCFTDRLFFQNVQPKLIIFIADFYVLKAFKRSQEINGEERRLPGLNLTNDQIFFLSFAQVSHTSFWLGFSVNCIHLPLFRFVMMFVSVCFNLFGAKFLRGKMIFWN